MRSQQAFGHAGAQAAHRHALFGARTGGNRGGRHGGFRRGGGVLHVFFQDAAVAAGALHGRDIHAFFGGQFGGGGHGDAGLGVGCGRGGGRGGCGGRLRGNDDDGFGVDFRQNLLRGNGVAFVDDDFHQHAGLRRGYFQHDFVGFDVYQHFVAGNGFAGFFVPSQQRAFGDAFGKYGNIYFYNHFVLLVGVVLRFGPAEPPVSDWV